MDFTRIATELESAGIAVIENFLPEEDAANLLAEQRALKNLRPASMGKKESQWNEPRVRGDQICWWEESELTPAQQPLWKKWEDLRRELNRRLFLGLQRMEALHAVYPQGASYGRHQDRFQKDDARVLSTVLYLNENWSPADGGELLIYSEPARRCLPQSGTAVFFLSELFHEVLPSRRERRSVAGWFKRQSGASSG